MIDLSFAYAKYLGETQNEPLPYEMASAIVPDELGKFILSIETSKKELKKFAPVAVIISPLTNKLIMIIAATVP